jgi:hypothetical protein
MDPNQGRTPDSQDSERGSGTDQPRTLAGDSMRGTPMWSRHRAHRRHRHVEDDEGRFSYHPPGE